MEAALLEQALQLAHGQGVHALPQRGIHADFGIAAIQRRLGLAAGLAVHGQPCGGLIGANGALRGGIVLSAGAAVIPSAGLQLVLQLGDGAAAAARLQRGILAGQRCLQIRVGRAVIDLHLRAHRAVLGDPLGIVHAQPDAAVGRAGAQVAHAGAAQRGIVLAAVDHGVEQDAALDAGGIFGPAVEFLEVVPFGALRGIRLGGQIERSGGRGRGRQAGGAQHMAHHGVVRGAVYGGDLVGQIHADPVGAGGLRGGRKGNAQRQAQHHTQDGNESLHGGSSDFFGNLFCTIRRRIAPDGCDFGEIFPVCFIVARKFGIVHIAL